MEHPPNFSPTLADHSTAAASSGNTILFFGVDDVKNTVLYLRGDPRPCYSVHTVNHSTKTTVHRGDLLLATIDYKTLRPDQITFPGVPPMNLGQWLKAPLLSTFPLSFEADGKRLEWREDILRQLSLHDHSGAIAWFSKSRELAENGKRITHDAFIAIKPEYDHMRDMIVVSCILAENKSRVKARMKKSGGYTPTPDVVGAMTAGLGIGLQQREF